MTRGCSPGTQRTATSRARSWSTTPAATSIAGVPVHDTAADTALTAAASSRICGGTS